MHNVETLSHGKDFPSKELDLSVKANMPKSGEERKWEAEILFKHL